MRPGVGDDLLQHRVVRFAVYALGLLVAWRLGGWICQATPLRPGSGWLEQATAYLARAQRGNGFGYWVFPIGMAIAAPIGSSRDVVRAGIALALVIPPAVPVFLARGVGMAWSVPYLAVCGWLIATAARAARRSDDAHPYLMVVSGFVLTATLASSLALTWWWPRSNNGGLIEDRLDASPYFVVATTFLSFAVRDALLRRPRAAAWALVGHAALGFAPHLGAVPCGCMTCPGPTVLPEPWVREAIPLLGLCWAPVVWMRNRWRPAGT